MELKIPTPKLVRILWIALAVLLVLHLLSCIPFFFMGREYPFAPFNLNSEQNIPTFFAVALLTYSSVLLGAIAWAERGVKKRFLQWAVLSLSYLLVAFDEYAELHEKLIMPLRGALDTSGLFHYAWVIPYIVILAIFVGFYARFVFNLPVDIRTRLMVGAILYTGGAIGMEMLNGAWRDAYGRGSSYYLLATVEEVMEFSGSIVFVQTFSNYITNYLPDLRIRITPS